MLGARRESPLRRIPLRLCIALAPQFVLLTAIFYGALGALGLNTDRTFLAIVSPFSVAGAAAGGIVGWVNLYFRDWRVSTGYVIVLAIIGIAVWLIASLV